MSFKHLAAFLVCIAAAFAPQTAAAQSLRNVALMPQFFEPNQGQAERGVDFLSRGPGYALSLKPNEANLQLISVPRTPGPASHAALHMKLLAANAHAHPSGQNLQPALSNYLIGNTAAAWRTAIPHYGRVEYRDVYPGIDIAYYGNQQQLEYDFILRPQADVDRIQLEFQGASGLRIDNASGDILIELGSATIRQKAPVVYQQTPEGRRLIAAKYVKRGRNRVGLQVANYDRTGVLVIDPVLTFSTYYGGNGSDGISGIVTDAAGNIYICGTTGSVNLTGTNIGVGVSSGNSAALVAKISPAGALLFATFIAGLSDTATSASVALDASGNIYVVGSTTSSSFPTANPIQAAYHGGTDAFLLELNSSGNALVFSTYIGGSGYDYFDGLAVDSNGNIYGGGATTSSDFPVQNAAEPTTPAAGSGSYTAFGLKVTGMTLAYSTYVGAYNYTNKIAIDAQGDLYVVGDVTSASFPTTPHAYQTVYAGSTDGFVQKLSPTGAILYSTYIGGSGGDAVRAVGVDPNGNLMIGGSTTSTDFPVLNPIQATYGGGAEDGWLAKLSSDGSTLLFSTYLGGNASDRVSHLTVDGGGNVYAIGRTGSSNFPTAQPVQGSFGGGTFDAYLTELNNSGSAILFSTYLGGSGDDEGSVVAVDTQGNVYLGGKTASTDFPLLQPFQTQFGGGAQDGFVAEMAFCAYSLSPSSALLSLSGGTGGFTVTTSPSCNWTAATTNPWITIAPPASGSGSATIGYSAAPNATAQAGNITIGNQTFTIVESGTVTLASVAPAMGTLGSAVPVTLTGSNFVTGAIVAVNNPGVMVNNVVVVSDTQITATLTISPSAATGAASVTVTTAAGIGGPASFTINQPTINPASLGLSPAAVVGGISTTANTVTLTGAAPAGGAIVTLASNNPAAVVPVSVTVAGGSTVSPSFTISTTAVTATTPVTISATYNGVTVTATLSVTPPPVGGMPVLQLHADATEISGTQNGALVTPSTGPSGLTGTVVVNGTGSVNFTPAANGNGVYFLNCCGNTNNAYYKFTGAALGNVFNVHQGEITFYLKSRYSFAQRKANASGQRYAFDVKDGSGNHLFNFMAQVSSGYLLFTYAESGASSYYYVPPGTEDALFGNGVLLQVTMAWGGGVGDLYLNGTLVKSVGFSAPAANWNAAANFDLGAFEYLTYGGYNISDDVIDEFTVLASPLSVSVTAPTAGATESETVAVTANATDIVSLKNVQFQLDGVNLGNAVTGAGPAYSYNWDTTAATNGPHTLSAVATDSAGNSSTSAGVSVTVNNITTPPTVSAVTLFPGSVLGGTSTTLNTVTLSGPAPNGGAVVTLTSNNPAAVVPASVTVAAAATVSPAFAITTTAVAANAPVTISATYSGSTLTGTLTVLAPSPSAVSLSPASVLGGTSTTLNTVMLNGPAPAGGAVVTLMSNNAAAVVPASVTVTAGATVSPAFTIATSSVSTATPVTISATYGATVSATLTVGPLTASVVTLTSSSVLGGVSTTGTVTLNGPAPAGGVVVALASSDPSTTVPPSVTVAGGTTVSPTFPITTTAVTSTIPVTISATYNGPPATAILTVLPPGASAVTLSPSSIMGGISTTANTVTLNSPAAPAGAVVTLTSNNAAAVVPASVTVAGGATISPAFTITTSAVAANTPVTISATYGGVTATATLTVQPPSPSTVSLSQASVQGGTSVTANTVTLNGPAAPAGAVVTLTSSSPAAVVPASVTVAGGGTVSPAFTITTTAVSASTPVTISATYGGITATAALTVQPPSPSNVTLSQGSVLGGTSVTANTVTLSGPAPTGGAVVTLTSNSPAATVPASVTVAAGTTVSPSFTITTAAVSASTPVTISATYAGSTATGTLTVQPPSPSAVNLSPISVLGGTSTTLNTITLNGPAPAGGAIVTLMSNNAAAVVPASVTVAAGATVSPAFTITTTLVSTSTPVSISATYNGVTVPATLTVGPLMPSVVTLASTSVLGGVSTTATVTLNGPAPAGGAIVTLASNNAAATVPASVTLAGGATVSPSFTISTTAVTATTPAAISATYNGITVSGTLSVTPPPVGGSPVLQLHADATEISGTQNGAIVTPSTGPSGLTGTVVVNGTGSVNFAPAASGNGVYFLNCCGNGNNAYYKFTGAALGNVFNVNQGQITFYLKSRYSFAQRKANASGQRYTFDVRDGSGNHLFNFMTQVSSGYLLFTYAESGASSYYYVPPGTEDALFGNGVLLQVTMAWGGGVSDLYLNGTLVKSVGFSAPAANWNAAANFDLGAFEYLTYGGYNISDDVIDEFTVLASPLSVSVTAPAAGATESGTVAVTANATDIVSLKNVQFQLDGVNLGNAVTGAGPAYTYNWDTTAATNGPHTLSAVATDSAGNSSTSAGVSVTVNNVTTPPTVSAVALSPGSVLGGTSTTLNTVTLSGPAPNGGAVVTLMSNNPAATVPASVTVAAAATVSPAFAITTTAVAANTPVTISATYSGSTLTGTLTVLAPSPSAVSLSPASVLGGTSTTLNTVTLNGPAPAGGAVVTLMSNNAAAVVPASVTVAAGTTVSPAFTIATSSVSTATPVNISATYGATVSATLTVGPLTASVVTLTSSSVLGGVSTTGTVTLNGPAPAGGVVVALASSDPSTTVPPSVMVAGGTTVSPTFPITTTAVTSTIPVTISATYNGPPATAILTVLPPGASAVTLSPSSVMGGISTTANTVTLNSPAAPAGAVVTLTSNNAAAVVPASVTVAGGATISPAFTITTSAVAVNTPVTISATYAGVTATATLTVQPPSPSTVSLSQASVQGGTSVTANTVTLNGPAPTGGAVVTLTSNSPAATVPTSVTVAGGGTVSPAFTITTTAVSASTPVTISATYGGITATATLTVQPPSPSNVTLSQGSVLGGTSVTANTVTLSGPAPTGGAVVTLTSNSPAATVPASVTVAAGATVSPSFTITTAAVSTSTPVTISATYAGSTATGTLTVQPPSPSAVNLSPTSVLGGTSTTLNTITLNGPAPAGGAVVTLASNNPAAVVPASVTVAAGATVSPAFTITTTLVSTSTPVSISATYNGVTVPATLTVGPLMPSVVTLASTSVLGGVSTTATVTLNGPAPAGGAIVTLASNNAAATVPASVTLAGGATVSPSFTISTTAVTATTPAAISATYNGITVSGTLSVTPPPVGGSPVLQLHADATEISGTQNGAIVTPSTGPSGLTGTVVVNGTGSVNFAPAESGNGVYFLNCCGNGNNAYYKFTGAALGNVFNVNQGQITFYLKSRYSFAQRKANASGQRYAFDVKDGSGNHLFNFMTQVSSGYLLFTYAESGATSYYYVPPGTEDALFGNGVLLQVTMTWGNGVSSLYLNGTLVKSVGFSAPAVNWNAASNFDLGAFDYLTYGGYSSSDDVIDEFTVFW